MGKGGSAPPLRGATISYGQTTILRDFLRLTVALWRNPALHPDAISGGLCQAFTQVAAGETVGHQPLETAKAASEIAASDEIIACTIKEACIRTGLGRTRTYEAIGSGELRAIKCGRRTLIEMNEIRRWIASLPRIGSG